MKDNVPADLLESVRAEAEKNISLITSKNKGGYEYYLHKEMKRLLSEKGYEWSPDYGAVSID